MDFVDSKGAQSCKPEYPVMMLTNIRSLFYKIEELEATVKIRKPNIICVNESWLHDDIEDSLVSLSNFYIYRCDRCNKKGGGVIIYVDCNISSVNVSHQLPIPLAEYVSLFMRDLGILVICLYIPPSLCKDSLTEISDAIVKQVAHFLIENPSCSVIILGDFNHFNTNTVVNELNLSNIVTKPTRKENILDKILISKDLKSIFEPDRIIYDSPLGNSDHRLLTAYPIDEIKGKYHNSRQVCIYDYRNSNMTALANYLLPIDWSVLSACKDVDEQWSLFENILQYGFDISIPKSFITMTTNDKPWLSPITKYMINKRWEAFREKRWTEYEHWKEKIKLEIQESKKKWTDRLKASPKGVWSLLKTFKDSNKGYVSKGDNFGNTEKGLSDSIADVFNFAQSDSSPMEIHFNDDNWTIQISDRDVYNYLRKHSVSKSSGLHTLPSKIFVDMAAF